AGEAAFSPDVTALYPGNARHRALASRPATGAAITESQAAARARMAARDHQAATGGTFLPPEDSGTVRRVRAHDTAYDGPRRGKAGIIAAVVALVLVAVLAALFMLNKCSAEITDAVPNLVGKSQTEAARLIKSAGFTVGEVTKEFSDTVEAGRVISQDPAAGTELEPGSVVTMVVSKGKELVTVPVITGKTVTELQQILEEAGLVPKAGEASYDAIVEINKVIRQDPVPGTKVEKGSAVVYVLSLGPENINVPNVVGSTLAKARSILGAAGFQVFEEHEYSDTVEKDVVIRQSPGANSKLEKGSSVTIIVSDGVEMVTIPSVTGLTMKEATSKLLAAGLNVDKVGGTADDAICIKQTPAASSGRDDTVPRGTLVTIQGQEWIVVPDIVGVPEANALEALQALGLTGRNDGSAYHDSIPAGCVIIQDPVAGSKIDKRAITDPSSGISTEVGYMISLGPEPAPEPPPTPPEPGGDEPGGETPGGGSGDGGSGEGGSGEGDGSGA
ncbi:MAG: PASTA domain-containing protein, partial [Eggerthellaceae bacterium]|nr:PASTA domain-containing protein [Eggerthellaceae bacterium]